MKNAVFVSTARTPFGRLGGALGSLSATTLGGEAVRAAVERSGIDPSDLEHIIMGNVIQAGNGQAPARQAMFKAGLAKTTTYETINKVCASGLISIAQLARLIALGAKETGVAGGMESMSNAPYALAECAVRLSLRRRPAARSHELRRAARSVLGLDDGASADARQRRSRHHARGARRICGVLTAACGRSCERRALCRGDNAAQSRDESEG